MKIIKTKVYTFDELNEKAKERARDWYREGNFADSWWYEFIFDDAINMAEKMGITIATRDIPLQNKKTRSEPRIYFSGFSSQGDGACFEGDWHASRVKPGAVKEEAPVDKTLHQIAAEFERIAVAFPYAAFTVKHTGRYCHAHSTSFDVRINDFDDNIIDTTEAVEAEKDLIEAARDLMNWIYRQLEKEYDWQNSDEQVDESIKANDYTFTESGKRFG